MTDAHVILWGRTIGAVSWDQTRNIAAFQYTPEFVASGKQASPIQMPTRIEPYEFPSLSRDSFKGLPGLLADSLPDTFGNALIDAWLARQGRSADSFNPVERLCYVGNRGMGALEFTPMPTTRRGDTRRVDISQLVDLANTALLERKALNIHVQGQDDKTALDEIFRVGTSAGGARAKAILAWNPDTNEFRSGQIETEQGFEHWLLKFDGISGNGDKGIADPNGYGQIEYAYALMALHAGILMSPSRLHLENGRAHFMTRRFDRPTTGGKFHMQSLAALNHFDYNNPAAYSYEQALQTIMQLDMTMPHLEQQFLRTAFNVIARNQDDHVKNIAFLMDKAGNWALSPAFDITYAWNPSGHWTSQHQMSINAMRDHFEHGDLIALAKTGGIKKTKANRLIRQVLDAISQWPQFAKQAGVDPATSHNIARAHRILKP